MRWRCILRFSVAGDAISYCLLTSWNGMSMHLPSSGTAIELLHVVFESVTSVLVGAADP